MWTAKIIKASAIKASAEKREMLIDLSVCVDAIIFILKLSLFILIGLLFAYIACRWRKLYKLGFIFNGLTRIARLPSCCSLYFLMSMLNLSSATPTLLGFYHKKMLNDRQVIVATITAGFPVMLWYIFFFTGPLAVGLLGIQNGLLFLLIWLFIGAIETFIGIIYGRFSLKHENYYNKAFLNEENQTFSYKEYGGYEKERERSVYMIRQVKDAIKESLKTLAKILKVLAPVVFILYIVVNSDEIMRYVSMFLEPIARIFPIKEEALPITIASAFNIIIAMSLAAQLIESGSLPPLDAFIAIVAGMLLFNIFEIFHTFIPYNVSFFGRKLGLKVAIAIFIAIAVSEIITILVLFCVKLLII